MSQQKRSSPSKFRKVAVIDEAKLLEGLSPYELEDESHNMTVLGRFRIQTQFYEETTHRLSQIQHALRPGIEYTAQELVFGELFWTPSFSELPEVVLSLKHLATQPDSPIVEVQWGTFRLATREEMAKRNATD